MFPENLFQEVDGTLSHDSASRRKCGYQGKCGRPCVLWPFGDEQAMKPVTSILGQVLAKRVECIPSLATRSSNMKEVCIWRFSL